MSDSVRWTRVAKALVLTLFIASQVQGIAFHEPWFDEAQSWLLARDASIVELFTTYLRYEGHPPLWYLLLAPFAKLGFPYKTINVIAAGIAVAAVVLLLRMDDVPLAVRLLLPFTYFFAYQYTIVARSYVLFLLLLVLLARVWPQRLERPVSVAVLVVLLSQVSVHGLASGGALLALLLGERIARRRDSELGSLRPTILAGALFSLSTIFLVAVLLPPDDLAISGKLDLSFHPVKVAGLALFSLQDSMFGRNLASVVALLILAIWLWSRRSLLPFVVATGGFALIGSIYWNRWHEGLFFLGLVFAILVACATAKSSTRLSVRHLDLVVIVLLVMIAAVQIRWTFLALKFDRGQPFSGSREAALFIRENNLDDRILFGAGFPAIGVQPYFEQNVFDNYRTHGDFAFWDWSTRSPWLYKPAKIRRPEHIEEWMASQLEKEPELFLLSQKFRDDQYYIDLLLESGRYQPVAQFPGAVFWKNGIAEPEGFILLRRTGPER